jgi:hypothetical protein
MMHCFPVPDLSIARRGFRSVPFVERVQCGIDLRQEVLDFVTLVRARALLQPFQQLLLSSEEVSDGRHRMILSALARANFELNFAEFEALRAACLTNNKWFKIMGQPDSTEP